MRLRHAFTLIELLIVVAIIAILAAIAVPNFLEAQTRAKVTRVKADMRTIGVAIEAYAVDYNKLPLDWAEDVMFPYYVNVCLSTPVAYLTNARLDDTFSAKTTANGGANNRVRERFRYRAFNQSYLASAPAGPGKFSLNNMVPSSPGSQMALRVHGAWFLVSKGPDASQNPLPAGFASSLGGTDTDWLWLPYDASNGTISSGDVIRSQNGDAAERGYPKFPSSYVDQ